VAPPRIREAPLVQGGGEWGDSGEVDRVRNPMTVVGALIEQPVQIRDTDGGAATTVIGSRPPVA
jgi:hypothetical protein